MPTYHYVAASERFLCKEEPLAEVLRERRDHYRKQGKTVDFWLVRQPSFLEAEPVKTGGAPIPRPAAAVVSTDAKFIDFMKLRLEWVARGQFEAPTLAVPDPLASL
ncbi:MAG: DUF2488 family protein [Cyanobacteria bacterium MAG CAR4_bin_6]|nr:DUF2488 family protein [Cyanobacteria bacterium MAG CAR4_bin_6]